VLVVTATLTFGSSLRNLDSHPALYGWNWNYAISTDAGGSVPPIAGRLLNHDPDVASWTGFSFGDIEINGLTVPTLSGTPHAALSPTILSGHGSERAKPTRGGSGNAGRPAQEGGRHRLHQLRKPKGHTDLRCPDTAGDRGYGHLPGDWHERNVPYVDGRRSSLRYELRACVYQGHQLAGPKLGRSGGRRRAI
jgi:hypothetical protein